MCFTILALCDRHACIIDIFVVGNHCTNHSYPLWHQWKSLHRFPIPSSQYSVALPWYRAGKPSFPCPEHL